jgi:hypothetical protein
MNMTCTPEEFRARIEEASTVEKSDMYPCAHQLSYGWGAWIRAEVDGEAITTFIQAPTADETKRAATDLVLFAMEGESNPPTDTTVRIEAIRQEKGIVEAMELAIEAVEWKICWPEDYNTFRTNQVVDWIRAHKDEFEKATGWRMGGVPNQDPELHDQRRCPYCGNPKVGEWQDSAPAMRGWGCCYEHSQRWLYESSTVIGYFMY